MSSKAKSNSQEICRMSWFLIEMDEGQSNGGKINGRIIYGVIHSIDIIDSDSTYMYINRKVRFNWNHAIIEGRVKLASDDRYFVEQQFKNLSKSNEDAMKNLSLSKRFLVQYNKGAGTMVHAIVHQKEVVWPTDNFENSNIKEVLIRDGKIQRMATVLHVNDSDDLMQKELDVLKSRCFDGAFNDPNDNKDIEMTPWLLVQYSNGPSNVIYTIVHVAATVWRSTNLYPNLVVYLSENDTVYQAIILRKTRDRNELDTELRKLKESCLTSKFPLATCSMVLQSTTKFALPPVDHQSLCAKPVTVVELKRDTLQIIRN
ncbi:hypothetical protein FF38_06809 [Lucilia cuprina]|uniref:Uncharacterized protein n=1 Tax=Lucilia cuprina TaxID=7375 RepID=A0A0L0C703_LUCCU|nr:Early boundary activity protein 3 [Lucilia cuprina]KNC28022.1 hypothetical protein FF38_06809 [Lucilia cuprina]